MRAWYKTRKIEEPISINACHPCAGAMLIFSVSFQFYQMPRRAKLTCRSHIHYQAHQLTPSLGKQVPRRKKNDQFFASCETQQQQQALYAWCGSPNESDLLNDLHDMTYYDMTNYMTNCLYSLRARGSRCSMYRWYGGAANHVAMLQVAEECGAWRSKRLPNWRRTV